MVEQKNELDREMKGYRIKRLLNRSVFAVLMLMCLVFYLLFKSDTMHLFPRLVRIHEYELSYYCRLFVPAVYFASNTFDLVLMKKNNDKIPVFSIVVFILSFVVNVAIILAIMIQ